MKRLHGFAAAPTLVALAAALVLTSHGHGASAMESAKLRSGQRHPTAKSTVESRTLTPETHIFTVQAHQSTSTNRGTPSGAPQVMRREHHSEKLDQLVQRARDDFEKFKPFLPPKVGLSPAEIKILHASSQSVAGARFSLILQSAISYDDVTVPVELHVAYVEAIRAEPQLAGYSIYFPPDSAWSSKLQQQGIMFLNEVRAKNKLGEVDASTATAMNVRQSLTVKAGQVGDSATTHLCLSATRPGTEQGFHVELTMRQAREGSTSLQSAVPYDAVSYDYTSSVNVFRCSLHRVGTQFPHELSPKAPTAESLLLEEEEEESRRATARLHAELVARVGAQPPASYDARTSAPNCDAEFNYPSNQGACGSCYAFAATTAATLRACMAGSRIQSEHKSLAAHDVLACGTIRRGSTCASIGDKGLTMDYADGCDGGSIYKIFEYAAEQGLYEEDCHTYTFSGDPVTHFTARADGSDPICTLRYHGVGVRRVSCGRSYLDLQGGTTTNVPLKMCQCPRDQRSGYSDVEVEVKEDLRCEATVTGSSSTCKLICDEKIVGKQGVAVGLGQDATFTIDLDFCRCNTNSRKISGGCSIEMVEKGSGAMKQCKRDVGLIGKSSKKEHCKRPAMFHSPRDSKHPTETLMKLAIMDGGPIVAGMQAYQDLQDFSGEGIYTANPGSPPRGGHAIVLFGWGSEGGKKFWWAKNSWGANWPKEGAHGIFKIERGVNTANIESMEAAWGYAGHAAPQEQALKWCEEPLLTAPKNPDAERCLRLQENVDSDTGRSTCTLQHLCTAGDVLHNFHVDVYNSGDASHCGKSWGPRSITPGSITEFKGSVNCCVREAEPEGNPITKQLDCLEARDNDDAGPVKCILENSCGKPVHAFDTSTGNFQRFYEIRDQSNLRQRCADLHYQLT